MDNNLSQNKNFPTSPIRQLLHTVSIIGEDFGWCGAFPQESTINALSILHRATCTLRLLERLDDKSPEAKEAVEFMTNLTADLQEIARMSARL